jgi:hypothetical protein
LAFGQGSESFSLAVRMANWPEWQAVRLAFY